MDTVLDVGHIFHHYLESAIPQKEWQRMSVEAALGMVKDVAALFAGEISASEFSEKYKLPRNQ